MTLIVFAAFPLLVAASGVLTQTEPPILRDPCVRFVCKNGGSCISPLDRPICQCTSGYGGNFCEKKVPVKDGTCPPPPNTDGLNCERGCDNDYKCPGTQKCCNTNCERQCTDISPPYPAPPALTCATVLCVFGSFCYEVVECPTCPIKVTCIPQSDIPEGDPCRANGYSQAILLESLSIIKSYSHLVCRGPSATSTSVCPSGSVCVPVEKRRNVCCRGKIYPINP